VGVSAATVTGLATTAVKAMRLRAVDAIELDAGGARGNRSFYVIDARGRMVNGKVLGRLQSVVPDYDAAAGTLTLTFPDGSRAHGTLAFGDTLTTRFHSRPRDAQELQGPWSPALSAYCGQALRLVFDSDGAPDRGRRGAASVISRASLRRLAEAAGRPSIDERRFRMLIEVDGIDAHAEDDWVGRRVRIGPALVAMHGHVGRCLITSRDPDTGEVDLPTLDLLGGYRRDTPSTEPLPFGIYGQVLEPGTVRVGDPVAPDQ
jgi:uncharacterized protein YcbX